jgi:hypothetical protein
MRPGALASSELVLAGLQLQLPTEKVEAPSNAPLTLKVSLLVGNRTVRPDEIATLVPAGAELVGTLTGPGLSSQDLHGSLTVGLSLPPLPQEGDYSLSGVRLVLGGKTILEAQPGIKTIRCLGEILLSQVTSTPMTLQELRDSGIQLGAGNYEGTRFTMALSVGSRQVSLSLPVAIPIYNGVEDPRAGGATQRLELGNLTNPATDLDLTIAVADLVPETGSDPFSLTRPSLSHSLRNNFKALLVIPGSIGYLHQFYRLNVVVFNTLKPESPFVVSHVSATYAPPPAADGIGPMRLTARPSEGIDELALKPLRAAGSDGTPGAGGDILHGGESGSATFYFEALKEGSHPLDFLIQGQFEGGDLLSPIPLRGVAHGKVLVRNPTFNLLLVHPDVVRKGETYVMEARLTNTSGTLANAVSISIDKTRLSNVKLLESDLYPAIQQVDTLNPGATTSFKFQFKALKTGEVRGSYLYVENGTVGFQLSAGLGERNVRLNPDTLSLPQTLDGLPGELREAMLLVLGEAYSVATMKSALPPDVLPIPRSLITDGMAQTLSEQGLFLKMNTERLRVWWELWKLFTQSANPGFDQLMRTTAAGAGLRKAFLAAWSWADPVQGPADRLLDLGTYGEGAAGWGLLGVQGAQPGLSVAWTDPTGPVLQSLGTLPTLTATGAAWCEAGGFHLAQFPLSASSSTRLLLQNHGAEAQDLAVALFSTPASQSTPVVNRLSLHLAPGESAVLTPGSALSLAARRTSPTGALLSQANPSATLEAPAEPFRVLGVHRYDLELYPDATPYGTQVMLLFNRPTMALNLPSGEAGFQAAQALVQIEGNQVWQKATGYAVDDMGGLVLDEQGNPIKIPSPPALLRAYPRVASLYLEKPVGPYVPRSLSLQPGWTDSQSRPLEGPTTWPIQSGWIPGGAIVKGKVRKLDGTGVPAKLTYWYYSAAMDGSQVDLQTNLTFAEEDLYCFFALVTNNVDTEPDGSYQLDFVPEPVSYALGPFVLQADLADGKAFAQASILGNGQIVQMDLVLEGKGSVEGYILDAQGHPVPDTQVQATQEQPTYGLNLGSEGGSFTVGGTSDASGHYRLDGLKTGVFSLRALKDLFGVAASGSLERDGQVVRQDLVLRGKTGSLKVQLLGLDGLPVLDQFLRLGFPAGLIRSGGVNSDTTNRSRDPRGALVVDIIGLPDGERGFVQVAYADQDHAGAPMRNGGGTLWRSGRLAGQDPGPMDIVAASVTTSTGAVYNPTLDRQQVQMVIGQELHVTVRYVVNP